MLLSADGVARVYGDRTIFEQVNLQVGVGDRLALIGENGSGKSTLLRVLAGLDTPDAGDVTRAGRVSLLAQHADLSADTVLDAVTPPTLRAAREKFERVSGTLMGGSEAALHAFAEAEERYRLAGGYDFEARAQTVLVGLKLDAGEGATQLSGGQMRRVMLARLLLAPADVYLLDEPTNHLDQGGAQWLEGWIRASDAAFVLASHDRAFLDAVATRTAELERGILTTYPGNHSAAMERKATLRDAQERGHAAYRRKKAALEEELQRRASKARSAGAVNMNRAPDNNKMLAKGKAQNAQNVNAKAAQRLQRHIERLDAGAVPKPYDDRRMLRLDLPPASPGPAEVLTVRGLIVQRGGTTVLSGVNLHIRRGDRVALTGPNGGGKSTLLRALLGKVAHRGEVRWGAGLTLYAAGQHSEELRGLNTVGDALLDANADLTPHQLYEISAQVELPGPAASLSTLSGGQRTRLSLARLNVTQAQVMVLDEPTNHLDIRMIGALEEVLLAYPGTVLLASHDRRLLERVAMREWRVQGGQVTEV